MYNRDAYVARILEERQTRHLISQIKEEQRLERLNKLKTARDNKKAALIKLLATRDREMIRRLRTEKKIKEATKREEVSSVVRMWSVLLVTGLVDLQYTNPLVYSQLMYALDAKLEAQRKKIIDDAKVEESIMVTTANRSRARQRKVESHRSQMRKFLEIFGMILKVFLIWFLDFFDVIQLQFWRDVKPKRRPPGKSFGSSSIDGWRRSGLVGLDVRMPCTRVYGTFQLCSMQRLTIFARSLVTVSPDSKRPWHSIL